MNLETIVGIAASAATASSLLPQLYKIYKDKKAGAVSLWMLLILFIGIAGWIYYGILKDDMIIIISNSFSAIINVWIAIASMHFKTNAAGRDE